MQTEQGGLPAGQGHLIPTASPLQEMGLKEGRRARKRLGVVTFVNMTQPRITGKSLNEGVSVETGLWGHMEDCLP